MDTLDARVDALERRVRALEALLAGASAGPAPQERAVAAAPLETHVPPPAPLAPPPRLRRPPAPTPRGGAGARAPGDLEAWLGGVLLARVGIAGVVLAAAYFAQLAYRHVGDGWKVLSLYALAGALAAAGGLLRRRASPRFVGLLWGGATAVAYVAGVAATLRYHLVDPWLGLALLTGAAALGTWFSQRLKVEAIGTLSLLAAVGAPIALRVLRDDSAFVLIYAAGLGLWGALAERLFGWRSARLVGLLGTLLLAFGWGLARSWRDGLPFAGMLATATAVLVPDLIATWRGRATAPGVLAAHGLGLGLLLLLAPSIDRDEALAVLGQWPGLCGLLWSGLAVALGSRERGAAPGPLVSLLGVLGGLALVSGAAHVKAGSIWTWEPAVAAAAVAGLLVALRRHTRVSDLALTGASVLALVLVGSLAHRVGRAHGPDLTVPLAAARLALGLVPAGLLFVLGRSAPGRAAGLLLGLGTLVLAFVDPAPRVGRGWLLAPTLLGALAVVAANARARRRADVVSSDTALVAALLGAAAWTLGLLAPEPRATGFLPLLDHATLAAAALAATCLALRRARPTAVDEDGRAGMLGLAATLLLLAAGGREVHLVTRGLEGAAPRIAMTLYLGLAGAVTLALGFRTRSAPLRWIALALFAVAVGKVGFVDLAQADLPLRVLVTGALGLVLLAAAYAYAKKRRADAAAGAQSEAGQSSSP